MPIHSKISQTPADKSKSYHKGVLYLQGIPEDTKAAFKAACARNEESMRDAVLIFMQDYAQDLWNKRERRRIWITKSS